MDDDTTGNTHQDLSAERAVLRAMFATPDAIAELVEILAEADFSHPGNALIYTAILHLYGSEEPVNTASVADRLDADGRLDAAGGRGYLKAVRGTGTTETTSKSWGKTAERIVALATLRRTAEAAAHIGNLTKDATPESVSRIVEVAQAEIFAATSSRRRGIPPIFSLGDVMEGVLDTVESVNRPGGLLGISTGFTDLDLATGGLQDGHLTIVASRPAIGKSTLAGDFLRSAAIHQGIPSAVFTLAASRNEVGMRLLAAEARVALHHMRAGTMTDDDWTKVAHRMAAVTEAPLYIQDSAFATFTDIQAQARLLHAQHDVRLFVVDALNLLRYGTRPFASRYEEISEISRCLKSLARELDVPVVALSQLNRGPEQRTDRLPHISDLRDSGALEDNADTVVLLHREDAYEKESPRAGEADLIIAKCVHGLTATVTVAFQGHYSRFVDMAQT